MKFRLALAFGLAILPFTSYADAYPDKIIHMVVAFPAGGPTDLNARLFAKEISDQLGQQVIVENKPGAGGNIASAFVASAPPDGYTVYYNTSSLLLGSLLYSSAKHDPIKDFVPVARTAGTPLVVAANASLQANSLDELIAYVKKNPGKVNYASSGAGTIDHLAGELLNNALGIKMEHVPYKGTAPAMNDLIGGMTQIMVTTLNTVRPFILDRKLKALAIASPNRSSLLPGVATVAEAAKLQSFEITAWQGIVVPAGTPDLVLTTLNRAVNAALQKKEFKEKLVSTGSEPYGGTSVEYSDYLKSELVRWKGVIQGAGIMRQ
jgi:tripartite-type tricarboxylate transporter receptor subunit TctC